MTLPPTDFDEHIPAEFHREFMARYKTDASSVTPDSECPFCHETGFDLPGLKYHLENYCEMYAITQILNRLPPQVQP